MKKVDCYDFDIFKLRELTDGRELVTVVPFILARHALIGPCKIDFDRMMHFLRTIASGYKLITYHN